MTELQEPMAGSRTCPDCESSNVAQRTEKQSFLYGTKDSEVELVVDVPVWRCALCDYAFTGGDAEEIRHEAVCRHFNLLTPREIQAIRKTHELTQSQLAEFTGIGVASIKRWETGALLQNSGSDKLLRLIASDRRLLEKLRAMSSPSARPPKPPLLHPVHRRKGP